MRRLRSFIVRSIAVVFLFAITGLTAYFYSFFFFTDQGREPIGHDALERAYIFYHSPINKGKVALTFDDGPTEETLKIADALRKENAPGTFFFVGTNAAMRPDIVKQVHDWGFEIGNHSFTHQTSVHTSKERLARELASTEYIISTITGEHTRYYRPPFLLSVGKDIAFNPFVVMPESANWIAELGYIPAGSDVDSHDWKALDAEAVIRNVLADMGPQGGVVLLHDRHPTTQETTRIIRELRARGYTLATLDEMMSPPLTYEFTKDLTVGERTLDVAYLQWFLFDRGFLEPWSLSGVYDDATVEAVARFETSLASGEPESGLFAGETRRAFNALVATPAPLFPERTAFAASPFLALEREFFNSFSLLTLLISAATVFAAGLVFVKLGLIAVLHVYRLVRPRRAAERASDKPLRATVLVPAYNEEAGIEATVRSLSLQEGVALEVIVIDDGSTDNTAAVVKRLLHEPLPIHLSLIESTNHGKPHALNLGLARATSDVVITVDADTVLSPNAVAAMTRAFDNERVGAAAGKVYTTHTSTFLEYMQNIEFLVGQNVDKRAFEVLNAIHVVPGPIGGWRRQALLDIGGFKEGTLVEDQDTTLAMLEAGMLVRYVPEAVAYAETPGTWRDFMKQRYRWTHGTLQCFAKYIHTPLTRPFTGLGFVVMPIMLFYGLVTPLSYVIVDGALLIGIASGAWYTIVIPVLFFMLFDTVYAGIGMIGEKNWLRMTLMVPVVRFVSRYVAFVVVIKSIATALEGAVVGWNKVDRTGGLSDFFTKMTSQTATK